MKPPRYWEHMVVELETILLEEGEEEEETILREFATPSKS